MEVLLSQSKLSHDMPSEESCEQSDTPKGCSYYYQVHLVCVSAARVESLLHKSVEIILQGLLSRQSLLRVGACGRWMVCARMWSRTTR